MMMYPNMPRPVIHCSEKVVGRLTRKRQGVFDTKEHSNTSDGMTAMLAYFLRRQNRGSLCPVVKTA